MSMIPETSMAALIAKIARFWKSLVTCNHTVRSKKTDVIKYFALS